MYRKCHRECVNELNGRSIRRNLLQVQPTKMECATFICIYGLSSKLKEQYHYSNDEHQPL